MRRPARAHRTAAALAALFLVASMGLAGWHRATVVHGRCAEHGDELHLEKVSGGTVAPTDAATASMSASSWVLENGDDHCEILAASHSPAAATGPLQHHVVLVAGDAPAAPVALSAPTLALLYLLAPKTSPPA